LSKVETKAVRERVVARLANVDPTISERVAKGLGLQNKIAQAPTTAEVRTDLVPSPALSILAKAHKTLEGRRIGCLVGDGTDAKLITSLKSAAKKRNAAFAVVATRIGGVSMSDGKRIEGDFQLAGGSSVLFDTVFVALSDEGVKSLLKESAAVAWVHDAFSHCKVIGATEAAQPLLNTAGVQADEGILIGTDAEQFLDAAGNGRIWSREAKIRTNY
jgi:catalase